MPPTREQDAVISHAPSSNARVLAGPGTGKSWTAVQFLERLAEDHEGLSARMLTFTRAATAEFAKKLGDANLTGLGVTPPATIHAFALGLLMKHEHVNGLPTPLRIAGKWESRKLIRPALRDRVRAAVGDDVKVTVNTIRKLEEWMASGWESLDPEAVVTDELDPRLINVFTGIWDEHREQFGYVLMGEVPYRAVQLVEDVQPDHFDLDVLLVDEYQDLNKADIRLLELVADTGVTLIAIGDDDQSIYRFRMAHPEGIRSFPSDFAPARDYPLTQSRRCGGAILDAATSLIEADPGRGPRPRLTAHSPGGTFAYLQFDDEDSEAAGVADIIADRIRCGVTPSDIAVLVRSKVETWAKVLGPALDQHGIAIASTDWVDTALLEDNELRRGLALAWLALDNRDSLSWWTLLTQTRGVGDAFVDYVTDARRGDEAFATTLFRLHNDRFPEGPRTAGRAAEILDQTLALVRQLDVSTAPTNVDGWGGWLVANLDGAKLLDESHRLLQTVGEAIPASEGLRSFLSQVEPVGSDLAASEADGVRLMTMSKSKGLTVNTAITVGVEDGVIPLPHPRGDPREERRLLYVAMTRATDVCVLTWAKRRTGTTAHLGTKSYRNRRQTPLLRTLPSIRSQPGDAFVQQLDRATATGPASHMRSS